MVIRSVALYARLSVSKEESVSIERQLAAARDYAQKHGWQVVLEAVDDGVSATRNKPEHREGWTQILDSPLSFQAVIVWKVDRLARKVLDFLHANESLEKRGAALVAVEESLDLTTPQGKAFATILATFGEAEAAAMSSRATAARKTILTNGRRAGGRPPFGYMNVPNPNGSGMVLAQDPETIEAVKDAAMRASKGDSLYSIARHWEATGVKPRARAKRKDQHRWPDSSVESILRNPVLAGMTVYTNGKRPGDSMPVDVLRGDDGMPIIDDTVAIMTVQDWRAMLAKLDSAKKPGTRPRPKASLLYGIARCGTCQSFLYRATAGSSKYTYLRCQNKECPKQVAISRTTLEDYVTKTVLEQHGHAQVMTLEPMEDNNAATLDEIEAAIADTLKQLAYVDDDEKEQELTERLRTLKDSRKAARNAHEPVKQVVTLGATYQDIFATDDVEAQRQGLLGIIDSLLVHPTGKRGNTFDPARVEIQWNQTEPTHWKIDRREGEYVVLTQVS